MLKLLLAAELALFATELADEAPDAVILLACELALLKTLLRLLETEPVAVAATEDTDAETDERSDEADESTEPVMDVIWDWTELIEDSMAEMVWTCELSPVAELPLTKEFWADAKAAERRVTARICCFILRFLLVEIWR